MTARGREAGRAGATSDTTRFRGVYAAALAAAVAAGGAAWIFAPGPGAPGPLSRPHARAGLTCASCHGAGDPGVAFAGGRAIRFGPGGAVPAGAAPIQGAITVPIVPLSACARCHDASRTGDPIAACVLAGQEQLGGARPTVCFDEHRLTGESARDPAREAAAAVAARAPVPPAPPSSPVGPALWLSIAGLLACVTWGGARVLGRTAGRRPADEPPIAVRPPEILRLPTIDAAACIGCYACVDACPLDVLDMRAFVARLARPEDCCGLTLCEQRCPTRALVMGDGEPARPLVEVDDALQSRAAPGLYVAGDVTGLPLIKNAINQGALAARAVAQELGHARSSGGDRLLDLAIVGAGPAGLSAALEAKARSLSYLALEQASVAESIKSFPRGKLVFDQPLELPLVGALWLRECTKEELLARWLRIARREELAIREQVRVTGVERGEDCFEIATVERGGRRRTIRARRVLLAVGKRGTPRKLPVPIPPALADRVHYSLADARSFAGRRVLVVGLGDVAMEAAVALSRQPNTRVTVTYRGPDFRRGKARNIDEMRRRIQAGAIRVFWGTEVDRVEDGRVRLRGAGGEHAVECDAVFVLIGSIPPRKFLARAGALHPTESKEKAS